MLSLTSLESMLAARYLRRLQQGRYRIFLLPAVFLVGHLAARGAQLYLESHKRGLYSAGRMQLETALRWGSLITLLGVVLFTFLVWLIRRYTIFSSISTFGLFLGSAALVVVLSVMSGFEQDLKHKILGANAHVLVTATEGQEAFTDYRAVAEQLRAVPGVDSVMPYLSNEVMVSSQANINGVLVKGIDPEAASLVTDLGRNLEQGKLDNLLHPEGLVDLGSPIRRLQDDEPGEPDPDAPKAPKAGKEGKDGKDGDKEPGTRKEPLPLVATDAHGNPLPVVPPRSRKVLPAILIGRELAKNLRVFLGDDVNVISPMGDIGPSGPIPRSRAFRVAGIFYSGMYEYDTKHVYMTIAAAQKFLSMGDEVTGLEVRVRDPDKSGQLAARLAAGLPPGRYDVKDWQELNKNLFSALKVEKIAMFIVLCFIILVAGFSIVANGVMLVSEKEQEIAILKAMGATDRSVLKTFLYVGGYVGGIGIGAGITVGLLACLALGRWGITLDTDVYYIAKLPVELNPVEVVAVFLASMAIAILATLYPALVAARLRPVDGLRRDHG